MSRSSNCAHVTYRDTCYLVVAQAAAGATSLPTPIPLHPCQATAACHRIMHRASRQAVPLTPSHTPCQPTGPPFTDQGRKGNVCAWPWGHAAYLRTSRQLMVLHVKQTSTRVWWSALALARSSWTQNDSSRFLQLDGPLQWAHVCPRLLFCSRCMHTACNGLLYLAC